MARRNDGTARRFDLQIFVDNGEGRAVAHRLDAVKASGESVSEFIREAIYFYIQHEQGVRSQPDALAVVGLERRIEALYEAVTRGGIPASSRTVASDSAPGVVESSGLNTTSTTRSKLSLKDATRNSISSPAASSDSEALSQQLIESTRTYGLRKG